MAEANNVTVSSLQKLIITAIAVGGIIFGGGILYAQTKTNTDSIVKTDVLVEKNREALVENGKVLVKIEQQFIAIGKSQTEQQVMLRQVLEELSGDNE